MACEVPVISSNTGGIPELNIHGLTGFLSEVGDVENMALNSLKLLQDKSMLKEFKLNALEQAKKFDIAKVMPQYVDLYLRALKKK